MGVWEAMVDPATDRIGTLSRRVYYRLRISIALLVQSLDLSVQLISHCPLPRPFLQKAMAGGQ